MAASASSPAASAAAAAATAAPVPSGLGDRAIKFQIKTGTARWACTLQDRSVYERTKAARSSSSASVSSSSSSTVSH
ncbi:hypothetical protein AAL_01552 [Moelleriella libera RCEF 2490]|uniref:Uncharacterized protein n=1 Tax=Moelleriella libera RCEF 2490 TaxID=1081109 RepID=A0A166U956_9HYPO|nr:hypothetical protein AAL_01552 [Moelleriella libera RCEF 2490]